MRYVQGIRDVIKANLWWSFRTERFLSEQQKSRLLTKGTLEVASIMPCCHRFTAHPVSVVVASTNSDERVNMPLPFVKDVETCAAWFVLGGDVVVRRGEGHACVCASRDAEVTIDVGALCQ